MTHNRLPNFYGVLLNHHTSCSYQIHKSCFYRLFSLQENDLRTSISSCKSRKKRKKRGVYVKPWLKRRKNVELYGTLLAELPLKEEYNYNIL